MSIRETITIHVNAKLREYGLRLSDLQAGPVTEDVINCYWSIIQLGRFFTDSYLEKYIGITRSRRDKIKRA